MFRSGHGRADAGAQFFLVVATGEVIDLARALEVDFLAQGVGIGEQSLVGALGDEAIESGVLGEDVGFFCKDIAE